MEKKDSYLLPLVITIPAAIVLFVVVLVFPAITSAIFGSSYVPLLWEIGFGLLWWGSDMFFGKIDGAVAGLAFLVWPMLFAITTMAFAVREFIRGSKKIRLMIVLAALVSVLVVVPVDYDDGSLFQSLPLWHKYLFITF